MIAMNCVDDKNGFPYPSEDIDYTKISQEQFLSFVEKWQVLLDCPMDYPNLIDKEDENLCQAYLLYTFEEEKLDLYENAWHEFLRYIGLQPTKKGVKHLHSLLDKENRSKVNNTLSFPNKVSFKAWISAIFFERLYTVVARVLYKESGKIMGFPADEQLFRQRIVIYENGTMHDPRCRGSNRVQPVLLLGADNKKVWMCVNFCENCGEYHVPERYFKALLSKRGMLIGNFEMHKSVRSKRTIFSNYQTLKLCGYSVSRTSNISDVEREYLISKIIQQRNSITRGEIINCLKFFIRLNENNPLQEGALKKWKHDLAFVYKFKLV